ncbi:MAG: 4-alpha-glucanotransferase [Treponemataceae bacterium]|nr:4-alpha-glucanotransferase [Treponemataceae bacterium]
MASVKKIKLEKLTGTSIPVGSLKTQNSCGVGEFLDLIPFADFCKASGLELIQLLPVNDTGTESSPYSALSAFALHPIYISLKELPEVKDNEDILSKISKVQKKYEKLPRYAYREIRIEKLKLLKEIFQENKASILKDKELSKWIDENDWIKDYSIFMQKKEENLEASWKEWKNKKHPSNQEIQEIWQDKNKLEKNLFYAWIQMRLDQQFKKASLYINSLGIKLKGDIPIMMNEDSCDTWSHPEYFNNEMRAGSPPDASNPLGQNWGFPIYNWKNLKKDDYLWWKKRLIQASKYYQAYRIDHILGFFRIWATPEKESTAVLGWPQPTEPISRAQLEEAGFDKDRITWLSKPHVPTADIQSVNNGDYQGTHKILEKIMDRIGQEELWRFKESIKSDKDIYDADIPMPVKIKLAEFWRNRTLIEISKDKYVPLWTFHDTKAWQTLNNDEKFKLGDLLARGFEKMNLTWEKQAKSILGELTGCTDMIACAEDLGSNPKCLPEVLDKLSILSLKVVRWNREWDQQNQPFVPFEDYPELSVTTSSVHDSSTLRSWWLNEKDAEDFYKTFGAPEEIEPGRYGSGTAKFLLETIAKSNSAFCIHPIQDFLTLVPDYFAENPDDERVNIPGSVNEFNWTYRLPVSVEKLLKNKSLISEIKKIAKIHKN